MDEMYQTRDVREQTLELQQQKRGYTLKIPEELVIGDLLEIPRYYGIYSHWAVYIGRGEVIHLAAVGHLPRSSKPSLEQLKEWFHKVEVRCNNVFDVVGDGKEAIKNNKHDDIYGTYSGREIVERAKSKLKEKGYNILLHNCEHFANWCRYNVERSDQANEAEMVVGGAFVAGLALAAAYHMEKRKKKTDADAVKNDDENDDEKIQVTRVLIG